jgi:hypothetical protein
MYPLVLILLGLWALLIIGGFYRRHRKEKRRAEIWFASQPVEILISGRRRAAERARALLKEQIDCDDFINEFGKSQDPEIQKLVIIVQQIENEEFLNEYRKPIEKRISVLEKDL